MSNLKNRIFLLSLIVFSFFALPSVSFAINAPTVFTNEATNIGENSAVLNGEITDHGGCNQLVAWFQYGTSPNLGCLTNRQYFTRVGSFSDTISDLQSCTTYYFRAVARNNIYVDSYGETESFTTDCPQSTIDIKANNSDGPITIGYNESATLSWTSQNATSCTASGDWSGSKATSGSQSTGNLTSSKTYIITCTGSGGSVSDSVTVNVVYNQNRAPVADAGPDKEVYTSSSITLDGYGYDPDGDTVSYRWYCSGGSLSSYYVATPTFYAPSVSSDTIYTCTLHVNDNYGLSSSDSMNIEVTTSQSSSNLYVFLSPSPSYGTSPLYAVDLTASVSGTATGYIDYYFDCTNDGTWDRTITGSYTPYTVTNLCNYYNPGTYTAKVRAVRGGEIAEDTAQINVTSQYFVPTLNLKANNSDGPITIGYNESATLSWTSQNATSCTASGDWSGSKATSGSQSTGNLTSSKTYIITCTGSGGSVSDSVTVNVEDEGEELVVEKYVKNLSDGTSIWKLNSVEANPGELISYKIKVTAQDGSINDVILKDVLPSRMTYWSNSLKIDGVSTTASISSLNIGDLSEGQTKEIVFTALIASQDQFSYGATNLLNIATAESGSYSATGTVNVIVTRSSVAGAATGFSTGITNNILLDSFVLPLIATIIIMWLFKGHIINAEEWIENRRKEYQLYRSSKILKSKIAEIKNKEF